jgi:hypothetical protein
VVVLVVVVDGTVDGDGADVEGAGAGTSALWSLAVDGGSEGSDGGGGFSSTPETSALGGGVETWGPSVGGGGVAPAAPAVAVGVVFGRGLEAPPESRMSTVTLTNPARNATAHAAAMNSLRMREEPPLSELGVCSGRSVETGGVACSRTKASRTVAGETGTLAAFRNPSPAKRVPSAESAADGAL